MKWLLKKLGYKEHPLKPSPFYIDSREVLAPIQLSCKVGRETPSKYIAMKLSEGLIDYISENMMLRSEYFAQYPPWDRRAGIMAGIIVYIRKPIEPRIDIEY
ncbi:hypothetical protein GGR21_000759 [Dysgonomonas hofstadii]|uniref:Uncharacterized protein n=1 Tax=Dysgonomonas hofstadii TaxID=637886 RepID=A0A840CQN1_9BACT|nr:hypothetical protein [Dysgonomonas hofstadii]MBB4034872.1 hypothetical protein [Dysgonomonas hofstadii]